jgi:hypothetical protein
MILEAISALLATIIFFIAIRMSLSSTNYGVFYSFRASYLLMRSPTLPSAIAFAIVLTILTGCGAKGDPKPNRARPPAQCAVRMAGIRAIEVVLPTKDVHGNRLQGIEAIRIYYLSLGANFPTPLEVYQQGEAVMELRHSDLPAPGKVVRMDLSIFGRPPGWLVAVPFRVGGIPGPPSQVLAWLDPAYTS